MIQAIFFALLIVTLLAGYLVHHFPSQKAVNPMQLAMDNSGYTSEETLNSKKTQQINMTTSKGVLRIRKMMDDLAIEQNKFLDTIQDQRQVLDSTSKDADDILRQAKKEGVKSNKDILQIETLSKQLQDERRLMVARGQDLISLNDQVTKSRRSMAEQISLANINTETSLRLLQQNYASLNGQAIGFFDKVNQHNQEVSDRMGKIRDTMQGMVNNSGNDTFVRQQGIQERIQRMLDHEHEDMKKLADCEERSRELMQNAQQNLEDARERLNDSIQRNRDLIEEERQKEEDQQEMIQQRIADQEQRMKDQQDHENP